MLRTPALKMAIGLSAFGLAGILMYIHYKTKDDDENDNAGTKTQFSKQFLKNITASGDGKQRTRRIVLPNDKIPLIVGRGGGNLKTIENKTGTVISFKEKDDKSHYCQITGKLDSLNKAEELIMIEINRSTTFQEEILVPKSVCGKIIGRCGESIQEICRKSLAKVSIDSGDHNSSDLTQRIVITGNRKQVNHAKKLIEEKIKDNELNRKVLEENELKREPRRSPTNSVSSLHSSLTSLSSSAYQPSKEKFTDNEKLIEVYVSAIASPAKFWLQLIGPQTKKLDDLVNEMTEYYNNDENKNFHKIADPYLGQVVAALFKYDSKWYRAEIVGILPNEFNPRDVVLDLYFIDYGDSQYVAPNEVFELRTDFLTLRCQAIECFLAHVKPINSADADMWDAVSISKFEELSHVASWKKLKSRIVTYKDRPRGGNHIRREGSPVPGVELFDTIEGTEINIGHMLISHGYATIDNSNEVDLMQIRGNSLDTHNHKHTNGGIKKINDSLENGKANGESHNIEFEQFQAYHLNNNDNEENMKLKNSHRDTENFLQSEKLTQQNHLIS